MKWQKAPEELVGLFDRVLPAGERIERRKMFGYPAAFANGQLFASLFQDDFIVRLPPEERLKLQNEHGARPFEPMPGRAMREYVVVPRALLADRPALDRLLACAVAFVTAMPPKTKKRRSRPG
jgi:TfoX/Sxy family transcriptional regulator of competence genes